MAAVLLHVDQFVNEQGEPSRRAGRDGERCAGRKEDLPPEDEGPGTEQRRGEVCKAAAAKTSTGRIGPEGRQRFFEAARVPAPLVRSQGGPPSVP